MSRVETLRALLARVEGATGPDRELDIAIWRALAGGDQKPDKVPLPWLCCYTSSVDAGLGLLEHALPGANYLIARGKTRATEPLYGCQVLFSHDSVLGQGEHDANQALAILVALFRALLQPTEASHG